METFITYNVNAFNSLLYLFTSNIWMVVIFISAIAMMIIGFVEEIETAVNEEQNIL